MKKVSLKQYFERILAEKDKQVSSDLASLNERLSLLNELRSGVATKDEVRALAKEVSELKASRDKNEGKGAGIQQFIGWIIAALALIGYFTKK